MAVRLVVRRADAQRPTSDVSHAPVRYEFEQDRVVIGRGGSADVRLPALTVSELHATLERSARGYVLRDEGSTNGTRINGTPLVPGRPRSLHDADELSVGEFHIEFTLGGPVAGLTSPEGTVSLAKRLLAEGAQGPPPRAMLHWEVRGQAQAPRELPPPPARWLVGRDPDAELSVDDPDVSRQQLELELGLDGVRARDLGSKNGMLVNGKAMRERVLRDGDRVEFGHSALWLDDPAERALRDLIGQRDVPYVSTAKLGPEGDETRTDGEAVPVESDATQTPEPSAANPAPAPAEPPRPSVGPDAIIYLLAAGVLIASGLGLMWLLSN